MRSNGRDLCNRDLEKLILARAERELRWGYVIRGRESCSVTVHDYALTCPSLETSVNQTLIAPSSRPQYQPTPNY